MCTRDRTLRRLMDKWIDPAAASPIRVTRLSLAGEKARYVRVEAQCTGGPVVMFFFRHDDGQWCVFPPQARRPMMDARRLAG